MQLVKESTDPIMQEAYRALSMDAQAKLPDSTVPPDGLLLHEFLNGALVKRFETFIKPRHRLLTHWQQRKAELAGYIEANNAEPRNRALDEVELKAASNHEIAGFKLTLGLLHMFAKGKRGFLGTIEAASIRPVTENVYRKDPMVMDIRVAKDTMVFIDIGGTTKTFRLKQGENKITVLAPNEAAQMKPWHGQVKIEVPREWRIPLQPPISINWSNQIQSTAILPAATGRSDMWRLDPMFMEINAKRNTDATIVMGNYSIDLKLKKGMHQYEVIPPLGAKNLRLWRGRPQIVTKGVSQPIDQSISVGRWK